MLNTRRQQILRLLLSAEGALAAAEIARLLECPIRAVRHDLETLAGWVTRYGAWLVGTAGVGYRLEGDRQRVREALDSLSRSKVPVYEYVLSPRERVRRFLLHLLGAEGITPLHLLAELTGVGKSTAHGDLPAVETWAGARGLALERSHAGVRLKGPESAWRQAMADLILELADEGQLAMLMDGHPEAESLQVLLQPMLPHLDWLAIGAVVKEARVPELGVYLGVMVSRLLSGHTVIFSPERLEQARERPEWRRAQALAAALENACQVRLPSTELAELATLLADAREGADGDATAPLSEDDLAVAKAVAGLVQSRLGVALTQDQEFVLGLALHLRRVRHRLGRALVTDHPLLDEVRVKFAAASRVAEEVTRVLEKDWHFEVSPAEAGYVAIHIAAALERAKLRHRGPRVLLVCGSGVGTAQLLVTRLQSTIPEVRVGRTTSAFGVRDALAAEQFDLVISTCQVGLAELPVVRVSPLLTDGDLVRIRRALDALNAHAARGRQAVLKELLTQDTIALDVEAQDWEAAVRAAGALLVRAGRVEERYIE
ncbi:MAG TPA: PRD domain-containing protein, partial [Firmicutes bacterium]|nr:PRD domain-containing protein [Bacillota bacterium]